ncbi:SDR family oxidoreductase [Flavobacteriaceae bacterium S356]|uniref:SDR family oxidoreductase n=1 Tax=Asprobacillus argus TaxID=3076534 RepID=A0ABU3LC55_9FLAO|nr:SDR family oxidoreductase [Flavobacteriaceae bacterium S356]
MILVTGGTGFVGAHLLYQLTINEEKIRAVYRTESSLEKVRNVFSYYTKSTKGTFAKIEWVQADITSVPDMIPVFEGVTRVYHCAALVSFDPKAYIDMRKVNIHGTAIIVNLAIDAKVDKLCFVSSIAAVGDSLHGEVVTEENEWNKNSKNHGYAISKYGAEMEVWRASQEGIDVIVVNPGVILGPGFWDTGSGKMFSQVYNGFKFYTEGVTGFVGVKDVIRAMQQLMDGPHKNERYILVSENKSFKEIFFSIADALHVKKPSIKVKPWQTAIFWRLDKMRSFLTRTAPLITKHSARSAHEETKYSSEKLKKDTAFEFETIEEVIKETSSFFP